MDEKTDALPSGDAALDPDADGPVGDTDVSAGTDNDASLLSDSQISAEADAEPATEVDPQSVVDAESSSTDTNVASESFVSENAISTEVGTSETSTITYTGESTTADVSKAEGECETETSAIEESQESAKEIALEKDEVSAETTETMEVEEADNSDLKNENPQETVDSSAAVCQLEEELKRLHGGDSEEEQKAEKPEDEITLKSLLKDKEFVEDKKVKTDNKTKLEEAPVVLKKTIDKPIMKDSDLEEMLSASADDIFRDPDLIKGEFFLFILLYLVCWKSYLMEFSKKYSKCVSN